MHKLSHCLQKIFPFLDGVLIPWNRSTWTKIALIMMQGWLGFPTSYVLTLGILQSIPNDLYEAAYIDGANGWQNSATSLSQWSLAVAAPTWSVNTPNFITSPSFTCLTMEDLVLSEETLDLQISWSLGSINWQHRTQRLNIQWLLRLPDCLCDCNLNFYDCLQETTWHLIWRMYKMKNSVQFKRRLNHFLTYLYMVVLSIVIIYPLLITVLSAFKSGNVKCLLLDFVAILVFDNFSKLFSETHYGTWYMNTLVIAIITMIVQTSIVTLRVTLYSRYNFLA